MYVLYLHIWFGHAYIMYIILIFNIYEYLILSTCFNKEIHYNYTSVKNLRLSRHKRICIWFNVRIYNIMQRILYIHIFLILYDTKNCFCKYRTTYLVWNLIHTMFYCAYMYRNSLKQPQRRTYTSF